jgi:hypothetical protein
VTRFGSTIERLHRLGALGLAIEKEELDASALAEARQWIESQKGSGVMTPTPAELAALAARFKAWLAGGDTPSAHEWGLAPFIWFESTPRLGLDERFAGGVEATLAHEVRPWALKRAVHAYLQGYSAGDEASKALGALIASALPRHSDPRMERWSRGHSEVKLFDAPAAPDRIADRTLSEGGDPRAVFRDLGFTTELVTQSGLHRPTALSLLEAVSARLPADLDPETVAGVTAFLGDRQTLRFEDLRVSIADRLLLPMKDATFSPSQPPLLAFFEKHFGDPRSNPRPWIGVNTGARKVAAAWFVRRSLELFMDVLSSTADPTWEYRRAFWLALHRAGLIEDAWPVFGKAAQTAVKHYPQFKGKTIAAGRLSAAQREQSVLLMRLPNMIVAEWSHAGKCRIYSANEVKAPQLDRLDYSGPDLRIPTAFAWSHFGSDRGTWQGNVANHIRQVTGVRISAREYMDVKRV